MFGVEEWLQMVDGSTIGMSAIPVEDASATDWEHYVEEIVPEESASIVYNPAVPNLVYKIGTRVSWLDETKEYWLSGEIQGGVYLNIAELYAIKVDTMCIARSDMDEEGTPKMFRVDEVVPTITPVVILCSRKFQSYDC